MTAERDARAAAERALAAKIKTLNDAQDRLLTEIDAQTSELERVDAELEAANAAKTAAEERVGAALEQAAAARVKSERLMEMLSEAEAYERKAADAEAARDASAEAVKKTRTGDESEEEAPEMYAGKPSSRRLETTATATVAAANENPGERDPASARLAAEILQGSELGRAYHPLLASIEARLLHLRSEKLDVALPDVSVA